MNVPSHVEAVQQVIPGLVGMATPTNAVYLRALQAYSPAGSVAGRRINGLNTLLYEINFAELVQNVRGQHWLEAERQIAQAANALRAAGAGFLLVTSNTGNTLTRLASIESGLPIVDIVTPTLTAVRNAHCRRAGLLSTRRTADSGIYQEAGRACGLEILAPTASIGESLERLIFDELIHGEVTHAGLNTMVTAGEWFADQGADALILGCTDMTHLAAQLGAGTTLFVADTTVIHATTAAQVAWDGLT